MDEDSESSQQTTTTHLSDMEIARRLQERFNRLQEAAPAISRPVMKCTPVPRSDHVKERMNWPDRGDDITEVGKARVESQELRTGESAGDADRSAILNVHVPETMSVSMSEDPVEGSAEGVKGKELVIPETVPEDRVMSEEDGGSGKRHEEACRDIAMD